MPLVLLPPELLDHTIDLLCSERDTLKSCSLVSKSWIPRTRKHLFARVRFSTVADLQSWKTAFPDPSSSPAYYTRYLSIRCPPVATTINGEDADWISTFSQVVHLDLDTRNADPHAGFSLVQLHGLSSILRSLSMYMNTNPLPLPPPELLNFIMSFPLLEDISAETFYIAWADDVDRDGKLITVKPSTPHTLTGCLKLAALQGMDPIASLLLSVPNDLHFRKLDFTWNRGGDIPLTEALVEVCHPTLECLKIDEGHVVTSPSARVDLGKATKLKEAVFLCWSNPRWISMTLQTITRNHRMLQRIRIGTFYSSDHTPGGLSDIRDRIGEAAYQEWLELDRLLVQFSESYSICLEIMYDELVEGGERKKRSQMDILLPEVMRRGIAGLIGQYGV